MTTSVNTTLNNANQYQKPISFGFESSSWNYGCFYSTKPYQPKTKIGKEIAPPIPRNTLIEKQAFQPTIKSSFNSSAKNLTLTSRRKLAQEEKIIKDDYVKNMNYLKITGTSKNKSNKPTKVLNRTNTQISNNIGENSENRKNQGRQISSNNIGDMSMSHSRSRSSMLNRSKSSIKMKIKYEDWLKLKNDELEMSKRFQRAKEDKEQRLQILKGEINSEYNPIKEEKIKQWEAKKLEEKQKEAEKKRKEEDRKKKEKDIKRQSNEEALNRWFQVQAEIIEKTNIEKEAEQKKKEKFERMKKINEDKKRIESLHAFNNWKIAKERELAELRILKEHEEARKQQKLLDKHKKHEAEKELKRFVIGPYSTAADLRKIKKHFEDNLNENNDNEQEEQIEVDDCQTNDEENEFDQYKRIDENEEVENIEDEELEENDQAYQNNEMHHNDNDEYMDNEHYEYQDDINDNEEFQDDN
jgi:hypothetical protein